MRVHKIMAGLWMDERKSIIVKLLGADYKVIQVKGVMDKPGMPVTPVPVVEEGEAVKVAADPVSLYYDEVASHLKDAESILLIGPGDGKNEIKKRIHRKSPDKSVVGIPAQEKMNEREVIALVRKHFETRSR